MEVTITLLLLGLSDVGHTLKLSNARSQLISYYLLPIRQLLHLELSQD
jgi:hypothetical protein